jgi:hypothetical protein
VPGYAVAFLLCALPLVDTTLGVWPPRGGEIAWRFGAAGMFSRALMTPLLGLFLAFAIALLLGHRRTLRTLSLLCALGAAGTLGTVLLFALDMIRMRAQVNPQAQTAFQIASVAAMVKYVIGALVLASLAVCAWRGASQSRGGAVRVSSEPRGPLLGTRVTTGADPTTEPK